MPIAPVARELHAIVLEPHAELLGGAHTYDTCTCCWRLGHTSYVICTEVLAVMLVSLLVIVVVVVLAMAMIMLMMLMMMPMTVMMMVAMLMVAATIVIMVVVALLIRFLLWWRL